MLTNSTFTIIRKMAVLGAAVVFVSTGETAASAASQPPMAAETFQAKAAPLATAAGPIQEMELFGSVAEHVRNAVSAELNEAQRKELAGTTAAIEVRYSEKGSFEMASVTANGINKLVTTIHRKIAWKSLPTDGRLAVKQIVANIRVAIEENGDVKVKLERI